MSDTDTTSTEPRFTRDEVAGALNGSADEVLDAIGAGDDGVRDVVNLLVNLVMSRLEDPDVTLEGTTAANYGGNDMVEPVLGWCRAAS